MFNESVRRFAGRLQRRWVHAMRYKPAYCNQANSVAKGAHAVIVITMLTLKRAQPGESVDFK